MFAENFENLRNFDKILANVMCKCLLVSSDTPHPSGSIPPINPSQDTTSPESHGEYMAKFYSEKCNKDGQMFKNVEPKEVVGNAIIAV